ncbi:Bifunctional NAD(P)H-hydrate repair enzyme Nnr [Phycisphaerales bacterium]|nr:Bifunctional NAD(P)H-hydrate repair enzyme Nnr [Phycisphaerales bacterium]
MTGSIPSLPRRDPRGHKGTFGTVGVVGGCGAHDVRMIGAPALAALGALRAGAGLVRLIAPGPILSEAIALCPSATGKALPVDEDGALAFGTAVQAFDKATDGCDALVIGPGWGEGGVVQALALRAVQQEDRPLVVDADALNALAKIPELHQDFRARAVLTPHPGEFVRLAQSLKIKLDPTRDESRPHAAAALAQRLGCVVVLKGAGTVVSDGLEAWTCEHRHACLAAAGTGDVLAGVIAGLLAQHAAAMSLFDLARLGVEAHARAGERWERSRGATGGMLASELAEEVPAAVEELRAKI